MKRKSEVTPDASNPVKKDTTTKSGRANPSPKTPLRSIAGTSIHLLKIDDLRMFCSRNGLRGSRKAKKVDVCWAICRARAAYMSGDPGPYKDLMPSSEDDDAEGGRRIGVVDDAFRPSPPPPAAAAAAAAVGDANAVLAEGAWDDDDDDDDQYGDDVGRASKRRRSASTEHPRPGVPSAPGIANGGRRGEGDIVADGRLRTAHPLPPHHHRRRRRLLESREEANRAIRLREIIDSAVSLRREIRDERDRRASLWREVVDVVGGGDEGAASARVGAAKEARRAKVVDGGECVDALAGGSHANVLLDNLAEQDESLVRLTAQHAALSGIVDVLIPREEGGPGEVAAAEA